MTAGLRRFAAAVAALAVFASGIPLPVAHASGAAVSKAVDRHHDEARAEDSAKGAEEDATAEDNSADDQTLNATATGDLACLLDAAAFFRGPRAPASPAIALIAPAHARGPPA